MVFIQGSGFHRRCAVSRLMLRVALSRLMVHTRMSYMLGEECSRVLELAGFSSFRDNGMLQV